MTRIETRTVMMDDQDWVTTRFQEERPRLRAVAYRMLGSVSDADDAVQEAWIRLNRADAGEVDNLGSWLTTVVARVSLNMLRSRKTRRETALEVHMPEPIVDPAEGHDPEHEALVADAVGVALLVVLETLSPAERLAFVLHDLFAVPFDEIAVLLDRSPEASRQLASRARRRVRNEAPAPDRGIAAQREVVDAFFAAARAGDLEGLIAVLDPDVVLRADLGGARQALPAVSTGAASVASRAMLFANPRAEVRPATINGGAGVVIYLEGEPFSVMGFTVVGGRVAAIDVLGDRERIARLDLAAVAR